ncbi:MAG: long-chain fatty acid--CoA ligase [Bacteroidota bacterium]
MNWTRTFEVLSFQSTHCPNPQALLSRKKKGKWKALSTEDCLKKRDRYSAALLGLGLKKGDRMIVVPELASVKWVLLDMAAQQIGVIVVPVHVTFTADQFAHVAQETEAKIAFFSHEEDRQRLLGERGSKIKSYLTHGKKYQEDSLSFLASIAEDIEEDLLEELRSEIEKEDLSCILYTSGTTGVPKGVMLTHENIVSNVKAALTLLPIAHLKRCLSFLPYSHIFERTTIYGYIASGATLYLPADRDSLLFAFKEARPHYFTAVPRILEKMVETIQVWKAEQNVLVRKTVDWAIEIGKNYKEGVRVRPFFWFQRQLAKLLVFRRFRHVSGGHVEAIFTGAAYLQPDISRIYSAAGIKVREGYGMTEASPIITMNRFTPGMFKLGTVGLPIPGVEIKIDEPDEDGEGEILVKGPNVMKGYYKRPEETARVLSEDGWLRTGDVGKIVKRGFLKITDRRKDIFKTSAGKYIAPLVLENHIQRSDFIEQSMIVGFQRPFLTALIKPNFEMLRYWASEHQIHWTSPEYMVLNIKIKEKIQEEVDKLNEKLPNFQKIRKFHLFHQELTPESGLITNTLKLMRQRIIDRFSKDIDGMYK